MPHFHARHGGQVAVFTVESFERLRGELPRRAERLVAEVGDCASRRTDANWELARAGKPLAPIDPLP